MLENFNVIDIYNVVINEIVFFMLGVLWEFFFFQLKIFWEEVREDDKKKIIKKVSEDCFFVCKVIVFKSGDKLFEFLEFFKEERIDCLLCDDLVILMIVYKNVLLKNLKK